MIPDCSRSSAPPAPFRALVGNAFFPSFAAFFLGFAALLLAAAPGAEASERLRFIADTDSAYAACLRRCARSDQLGNLTRNGCMVGCAQARKEFPLEGCTYRNHEGCNEALMDIEMNLDEMLAEQYAWCNEQWPHPHRRKGCKDAIEVFYQTAVKQVCRPAGGTRPPHTQTAVEGTTVVPTGATFARSGPPSAVAPLEQPQAVRFTSPASQPLSVPLAPPAGAILNTPQYDQRFYRTRPASPVPTAQVAPAAQAAPKKQAATGAKQPSKKAGGKTVPVVTPSTALPPKSTVQSKALAEPPASAAEKPAQTAEVTPPATVQSADASPPVPEQVQPQAAPQENAAAASQEPVQAAPAPQEAPLPVVATVPPVPSPGTDLYGQKYSGTPGAYTGPQAYSYTDIYAPPAYRVIPPKPVQAPPEASASPEPGPASGASSREAAPPAPAPGGAAPAHSGPVFSGPVYSAQPASPAPYSSPASSTDLPPVSLPSSAANPSLLPAATGATYPPAVPFRGDITETPLPLPQPTGAY